MMEKFEFVPLFGPGHANRYALKVKGDQNILEQIAQKYPRFCQKPFDIQDGHYQWGVYVIGASLTDRLSIQDDVRILMASTATQKREEKTPPPPVDLSGVLEELNMVFADLTTDEQKEIDKKLEKIRKEEGIDLRSDLGLETIDQESARFEQTAPSLPSLSKPSILPIPDKKPLPASPIDVPSLKSSQDSEKVLPPLKASSPASPVSETKVPEKLPIEEEIKPEPAKKAEDLSLKQEEIPKPEKPSAPPPPPEEKKPESKFKDMKIIKDVTSFMSFRKSPPPPPSTPITSPNRKLPSSPKELSPAEPSQSVPTPASKQESPVPPLKSALPPKATYVPRQPGSASDSASSEEEGQVLKVACIFPTGHSEAKDDFISKISEVTKTRARKPLILNCVEAWEVKCYPASVEWIKQAKEAGAEALLVLIPMEFEIADYEILSREAVKEQISCHIVPIGKLDSKILYVNLMVELMLVRKRK